MELTLNVEVFPTLNNACLKPFPIKSPMNNAVFPSKGFPENELRETLLLLSHVIFMEAAVLPSSRTSLISDNFPPELEP